MCERERERERERSSSLNKCSCYNKPGTLTLHFYTYYIDGLSVGIILDSASESELRELDQILASLADLRTASADSAERSELHYKPMGLYWTVTPSPL